MSQKYVYLFSEGNETMRELLGGKGANLAGMTRLGMPVPRGFTVSTEACTRYYEDGMLHWQRLKKSTRRSSVTHRTRCSYLFVQVQELRCPV